MLGVSIARQDVNATVRDIEAIVDFFQSGINLKSLSAVR